MPGPYTPNMAVNWMGIYGQYMGIVRGLYHMETVPYVILYYEYSFKPYMLAVHYQQGCKQQHIVVLHISQLQAGLVQ